MQVATPEALLQALLLKGGAIVSTGQIPEAISATVLAGGSITESFIREDGVGFVRVDRVPASIPHVKGANSEETSRPAYQVRVIEEKAALDAKLDKLQAFLAGDASTTAKDRGLLLEQAKAMVVYSTILGERIEGFDA